MKQKIEEGDKREKVGVPTTGLTEQGMFSLFSCFLIVCPFLNHIVEFKLVLTGEKDWMVTKKCKLHE